MGIEMGTLCRAVLEFLQSKTIQKINFGVFLKHILSFGLAVWKTRVQCGLTEGE